MWSRHEEDDREAAGLAGRGAFLVVSSLVSRRPETATAMPISRCDGTIRRPLMIRMGLEASGVDDGKQHKLLRRPCHGP